MGKETVSTYYAATAVDHFMALVHAERPEGAEVEAIDVADYVGTIRLKRSVSSGHYERI